MRVLNLNGLYPNEQILNLLLKNYMDKGNAGEVNYIEFCNDVDRPEDIFGVGRDFNHSYDYFPKTKPKPVETDVTKLQPEDLDDVLARLRRRCMEERIRINEFLRDFDKLRSGHITVAQLRIGLNMAKISLSAAEFQLIVDGFGTADKRIRWRDFVDAVDEVFTKKNLEKNVDEPLGVARTTTVYKRAPTEKDEKSLAEGVTSRFRELLVRERLNAKSFFQNRDLHNHYKVSPKIFRQVLATLGFQMSDAEQAALTKMFGTDEKEIKYLEFLSASAPRAAEPDDGFGSRYRGHDWDFKGESSLRGVMNKVKVSVKKDRIRLLEFFYDHDILRKGYVPRMKFQGVLYSQKVVLTNEEFELLHSSFSVPNNPEMINYVSAAHDAVGRLQRGDRAHLHGARAREGAHTQGRGLPGSEHPRPEGRANDGRGVGAARVPTAPRHGRQEPPPPHQALLPGQGMLPASPRRTAARADSSPTPASGPSLISCVLPSQTENTT